MRAVLITALLLSGCSKKDETKSEPAAAPAPEVKNEEPKPDTPPEPPAPPAEAPKVDCDAIVTAADIEKHCKAKVEIAASQHEGKLGKLGVCSRTMTEPGKKFPVAHWKLGVHDSPAGAEGQVKLEKTDAAKDLAGLGDMVWTKVDENKQLKHTNTAVGVRKGASVLVLHHTKDSLNTKPPCTVEQLVEVAREAIARLP